MPEWEVPFQIETLSFRNENEALSYLCEQQLKRDDLTREYQRYLLGRQFRADMEIATCRYMEEHPEQELNSYGQVSQKYVKKYEVAEKIGIKHNLCSTTIIKYDIYARSIDGIRSFEPEVALKNTQRRTSCFSRKYDRTCKVATGRYPWSETASRRNRN